MLIQGKKIILRTVHAADADTIYLWENNKSIWDISGTTRSYSKKEIKDFILEAQKDISETGQLRFMICLPQTKTNSFSPIGCIDLFDFNKTHLKAGIGVLIADKKQRLKGYGSEALELLIHHSFNKLQLHQLYCCVIMNNTASLKLFKKNRFKISGAKKDWIKSKGKFVDEYILQRFNNS